MVTVRSVEATRRSYGFATVWKASAMRASPPPDDDRDRLREWAAPAGVSYLYPITFTSPGKRTPETREEDLAISEVESLICSILAAKADLDIAEVAGMRRDRLGERAGVIVAAPELPARAPAKSCSRELRCGSTGRA
jgi:hypothetical protein